MGLLDFNLPGMDTAEGQGLLAASLSLMGATKMPGQKGAFGQALAGAGQQYMQTRGNAQNQMDDREVKRLQIDGLKRRVEQEKQQAMEAARVRELMSSGGDVDYQSLIRQGVPFEMVKQLADSRNLGREKVARTVETEGPGGTKLVQGFDDYGMPVGQGANGYVAPQLIDQGNRKTFAKPMIGQSFPISMSPAEQSAANNRNQSLDLQRQRLQFDREGGPSAMADGGATQANFNKQFGKAQAGYRWKPDGSLEFIPGGPADQKAQAQKGGEGTVGGVVADLRDKYSQLDSENGIVSTNNRFGTNIGAWVGSTGVGQTFNGMVGTKTQSARDSIAMTRPLLLQAIMKATGMSAKQMDSNAELKLYLATATDPQKGLEANIEALNRIESLYGGGMKEDKPMPPRPLKPPKANGASGAWSIEKVD